MGKIDYIRAVGPTSMDYWPGPEMQIKLLSELTAKIWRVLSDEAMPDDQKLEVLQLMKPALYRQTREADIFLAGMLEGTRNE